MRILCTLNSWLWVQNIWEPLSLGACSPPGVLRSVWTSGEVALGSSVCPSIPWCVQCRGWGDALSPPGRRWSLTCFRAKAWGKKLSKKPIAKTICKGWGFVAHTRITAWFCYINFLMSDFESSTDGQCVLLAVSLWLALLIFKLSWIADLLGIHITQYLFTKLKWANSCAHWNVMHK